MTQIPEWANWLARNKYGKLWAFKHHPTKMIEFWFVREGAFDIINEVDNRYAHIKWTDEEPTKIKKGTGLGLPTLDKYNIAILNNHEHDKLPRLSNPDMINQPNHYIGEYGL